MNRHPCTIVMNPWTHRPVEIDDDLVPIIRALWRRAIRTMECCQDIYGEIREEPHMCFISFSDPFDAASFLVDFGPERVAPARLQGPEAWQATATHWLTGHRSEVVFPHDDIPVVMQRLAASEDAS